MYLLKVKKKEDETKALSIELKWEYKEFATISEIIEFIHKNSMYIASYKIFNLVDFEKEKDHSSMNKEPSYSSTATINKASSTCGANFR